MLPPSRIATLLLLIGTEEDCAATRRGSAVAVSVIHRAGVPVVGGLARLHRVKRRDARPNSLPPLVAARSLCPRAKSATRGRWRNPGLVGESCGETVRGDRANAALPRFPRRHGPNPVAFEGSPPILSGRRFGY